ncbi:MAG: xanthine dehydrogenase family protein subunit M [Dehalococcoidia bacterium]
MRAVTYLAPRSIEEAVSVLAEHGTMASVLAGGTDVIIQAREGRKLVDVFVDVKNIAETRALAWEEGGLLIGAAVPCAEIYEDSEIASRYPALIDSAALIGGIQIQSRASLGGNLCNASPAGDSIPTLIVLGAIAVIAGASGRRELPVEDFCVAPGRNALQPGEMLVALRLPAPRTNSGAAFERFIPRNEMDIAVCNCAASVVLSADGQRFESGRLAVGAVAPTPLLVADASAALEGQSVSDQTTKAAADRVAAAARPITDMRGSIAQRKHLAAVLATRVINKAVERARGRRA